MNEQPTSNVQLCEHPKLYVTDSVGRSLGAPCPWCIQLELERATAKDPNALVMKALQQEVEQAVNRVSAERGSNTPDFILAEYLTACLVAFDRAVQSRERWYGRENNPPGSIERGQRIDAGSHLRIGAGSGDSCAENRSPLNGPPDEPRAKPFDVNYQAALVFAVRELLGSLPKSRDWLNPDAERIFREYMSDAKAHGQGDAVPPSGALLCDAVEEHVIKAFLAAGRRATDSELSSIASRIRASETKTACEHCTPERKCPDHGAALTSNDD